MFAQETADPSTPYTVLSGSGRITGWETNTLGTGVTLVILRPAGKAPMRALDSARSPISAGVEGFDHKPVTAELIHSVRRRHLHAGRDGPLFRGQAGWLTPLIRPRPPLPAATVWSLGSASSPVGDPHRGAVGAQQQLRLGGPGPGDQDIGVLADLMELQQVGSIARDLP
ncbi:MAG TPA: hypothetical protein VGH14_12505 [Solirubrobacterales bacterium]